ncbi:MAG: cytochrome C [Cyclobacteriaceae bacterium]
MSEKSKVIIYLDDETSPIGAFDCPVKFNLDTTKIQDGNHVLKMISKDTAGKEGIRLIPFVVRNGPEISIEGLKENSILDGEVPILINAHGKSDQRKFVVEGSETPRSVPSWVWALVIFFFGWAAYYTISSFL